MYWFPERGSYTSETKPFYLTSEFLVFALYLMGLGIAVATSPGIDARLSWILATVAVVGYMLSRANRESCNPKPRPRPPRRHRRLKLVSGVPNFGSARFPVVPPADE